MLMECHLWMIQKAEGPRWPCGHSAQRGRRQLDGKPIAIVEGKSGLSVEYLVTCSSGGIDLAAGVCPGKRDERSIAITSGQTRRRDCKVNRIR